MKTYTLAELSSVDTPILVPLYEGADLPQAFAGYAADLDQLELEAGKQYYLLASKGSSEKSLILLGLGKPEKMTGKKLRETVGAAIRSAKKPLCVFTDPAACEKISAAEAAAESAFAAGISQYNFTKIGSNPEEAPEISFLSSEDISGVCRDAALTAACVNHARDLSNMPSNLMTPEVLAEEARKLAGELNLECEILTNKELEEMGAGAILGVNRGSSHGARMIAVKYEGAPGEEYTALVGKGLTFDAGGYNLKSAAGMVGMKMDMCGAANVLAALELIARRKEKVNVMAVIGATENKIGPDGFTCDDVLTSLSGKTIEITNTDAEGRLVLCDAITWAQRLGAKKIIDMATLTGACVAALGSNYTGAFTNAPEFLKELQSCSEKTEEKLWQLPIDEDLHKMVCESSVADMNNCVKNRGAGSSLAAAFLEEFVEEGVDWIHLDIAGTSDFSDAKPYIAKGANGVLIRTLGEMFRTVNR